MYSLNLKAVKKYTIIIFCFVNFLNTCVCMSEETEIYEFERMWPTLRQPWYSWMVNDLETDNKGYIFFPDSLKCVIHKYTLNGQFVTKFVTKNIDPQVDLYVIGGIAICPKGNIYIINIINDSIDIYSFDGQLIGELDKMVYDYHAPVDIAIDINSSIFIAENKQITKYTEDGEMISRWGDNIIDSISFITVDTKGFVYVTDNAKHCFYKFDSRGNLINKWGEQGSENSKFNNPRGIALDSSGNIFVVDAKNFRIQKFDNKGKFLKSWGSKGNYTGQFNDPSGISIDIDGYVYVSDMGYHRIQKFSNNGDFIDIWTSIGLENGFFNEPDDIAIDSENNVYIADAKNHRIQKFNKDGHFLQKWGKQGSGAGQFDLFLTGKINEDDTSMGLAIDINDIIYVTDSGNHRIQKFDTDGNYIGGWGKKGSGDGDFSIHVDIILDSNNYVYVSDIGNNCIQKFSSDGQFIRKISGSNGLYTIANPTGLAVDKNDYLYVINIGTFQILKFDSQGAFNTIWKEYYTEGTNAEIRYPQSIIVDANDYVYVTEGLPMHFVRSQVNKYNNQGEIISSFGSFGSNAGQFYFTGDIAIDENNNIYVTDRYNHRVQVFHRKLTTMNTKAIIVAGNLGKGDPIWDKTQVAANFAYRALNYKGLLKSQICYLSSETNIDLDGNTLFDDIYEATKENMKDNILTWANGADNLIVYLVDHGDDGVFMLGDSESLPLSANQLDQWLDTVESSIDGRIIVIYDACKSGSFHKWLNPVSSNDKRIVVTSAQESAHFKGPISFSNFFWSHIFNNYSLYNSFDYAMTACLEDQKAQIDANGNGYGNENEDFLLSKNIYIGNQSSIQNDIPVIQSASPEQTIYSSNSAKIFAELATTGPNQVWAEIIPPHFDLSELKNKSILRLPTCVLINTSNSRYENIYENFNMDGTYLVKIYAKDSYGNLSLPKITKVTVNNPKRRKSIIIAGEVKDDDWFSIEKSLRLSYEAMLSQGYTDEDIYILSPKNFSTGENVTTTIENVNYALSEWVLSNTIDVVIYLIGYGEREHFILNPDEKLSAQELSGLLNKTQQHVNGIISVIYDADFSETFLPFISSGNMDRILVCGTGNKCSLSNGDICFSTIFWRNILNGKSIYNSFINVKEIYQLEDETYEPQLDDNGNGKGNETESNNELPIDGHIAKNYWIGLGIITSGIDSDLPIDSYEPNNLPYQANIININEESAQAHNFHYQNDTDWIVFYGINQKTYVIDITNVKKCNVMFDLFDKELNKLKEVPINNTGYEEDEFLIWESKKDSLYYVNIQNVNKNNFGEETGYEIRIKTTDAPAPGNIFGKVYNVITKEPVPNARIKTSTKRSALSDKSSNYRILFHEIGSFAIYSEADGFHLYTDTVEVQQSTTTTKNIPMTPLGSEGMYNLSINISGGCGSVIANGMESNNNSVYTFQENSIVEMSYKLSRNNCTFINWSGDCTGTTECQVIMDKSRAVYANFIVEEDTGKNTDDSGDDSGDDDDSCCCFISTVLALKPILLVQ